MAEFSPQYGVSVSTIASEAIQLGGALRAFGLICAIAGVVIVVSFGIQAILSLSPLRLKVERATEPLKKRWKTAGKVLMVVASVLVASGTGFLAVSTSKQSLNNNAQPPRTNVAPVATVLPTIRFSNPRGTIQNPLTVPCQEDIEVAGRMPKGYTFAVGNVLIGQNADIVFVPEQAASLVAANTWKVPVVFGQAADSGSKFSVYLEVLPMQQMNYLVAEAQSIREFLSKGKYAGQTWWRTPILPPAPAIDQDQETVQRTADKAGCPS
jgi:hypothetical protein